MFVALNCFVIATIVCVIALSAVSIIIFKVAICAKNGPAKFKKNTTKESGLVHQDYFWISQCQKVTTNSSDGLQLASYQIKMFESDKWVIVVHGYGGGPSNMLKYIDYFIKNEYNVLAVCLRGHGLSQGKYYGLGYLDAHDLLVWSDFIANRYETSKISLFGISMGGATCLIAAAKYPEKFEYVISDSAPSSFKAMFYRLLRSKFKIFTRPLIMLVSGLSKLFAGYSLNLASPLLYVEDIVCPVLYIHGEADGFVPVTMVYDLYDKTNAKKVKLVISDAEHTQSVDVSPEKYWETISDFIEAVT